MKDNNQLDNILLEIGVFGKYQQFVTFLFMIIAAINYFSAVIYVFETLSINHRCFINDCDSDTTEYNPSWLINAVPFKDDKPARCTKYHHTNNSSCTLSDFNKTFQESCNSFIYETSEKSIMQDFNLHCDNNVQTLAFVGTLNGVGKFVGLPISGYISDRFGRKKVLIIASIITGIFGLVKAFSTTYIFFIVFEVLEACVSTCIYASIYVLSSELAGLEKRPLITTLQFVSYSLGGVVLGTVAWRVQSWRLLLQILYPLNFIVVLYIWLVPESVRWLLANNKEDQAKNILRRIAIINKKPIPEEKIVTLSIKDKDTDATIIPITNLFKSKILLCRCIICSFCWITCIFVYYGLTITATTLSNNHYLDFIATSAVEIPGYILAYFIVNKLGRKVILSGAFMLSSISCIAFIVLPVGIYWVHLLLYLISKFGISIVVYVIYIITNEMFPTSLRQTILSTCSMFGRVGNMLVPQLTLLQEIWIYLPLVLFAVLTGISSILTLRLPETQNTVLPNTIEEAEIVGTEKKCFKHGRCNKMSPKNQLDSILIEIGEYGKYQWFISVLVNFLTAINFFSVVIYVFETTPVNHRCLIPDCDFNGTEYNSTWLINAVPFKGYKPARCTKFEQIDNSSCNAWAFNTTNYEVCDTFVYETSVKSILQDFNLHCDANLKALALVGTINGIGRVFGLPIAGYISDRYGRKHVLIWSMVIGGMFGIIRSFATSYGFFIACEFLEALFSSGGFTSGYVLGTEFVGPSKRALVGTLQFLSYGLGSIVLGGTAWMLQSWRVLLRVLYVFYLLILSYYWLIPESVRWLLTKNRHEEAITILRNVAKVNGKEISKGRIENMLNSVNFTNPKKSVLIELFKSKVLATRCFMCSFCWFTSILVYYGLTIVSTTLSGNRYLDFILTCAIEAPAAITALILQNKLGRKTCLCVAMMLSTLSSISYIVVPTDTHWVKLSMYLVSKFGISMSVAVMYTITNELFPTSIRQTLLSICSMFGRMGNVLVPQLIILVEVWKYFPLVVFAILTGISFLIALCFPETRNITLPDTIEDSKLIIDLILGTEFVGPKKRAVIATIQFMSFGIGSVILGSLAWLIQSWRILLRVLYIFYLVIITYYWLLPESVRWLLAKKRQEEAVNTIRKIAKVNNRTITEGALENLLNMNDSVNTNSLTLRDLFKLATLTIRCAISSFCWMSTLFVYYGLSITSTTLSGNRYFDFVLTSAVEVPAFALACLILNKLGRKHCIVGALTLTSISSISFIVLPIDSYWIKLVIYLTSKFGITMCVSGLYMITNEMFPTSLRQTLLSICSMFGRIGNVLVPQLFLL
ncbi:hypothetical protein RN001_006728, partial [Aquatica leii]